MSSMALTLRQPKSNKKWLSFFVLISIAVVIGVGSGLLVIATGLGGYVSEKLIARQGVNNSSLTIDRSGIFSSDLDITMGMLLGVGSVTNAYMDGGTHATLNGSIISFNGFSASGNVYFQWGYDTSYGQTTATQVISGLGSYSAAISGFDPTKIVYFRIVAQSNEGTTYSSAGTFNLSTLPPSQHGTTGSPSIVASYSLAAILLPLFVVIIGLIFLFRFLSQTQASNFLIVLILGMTAIIVTVVFIQQVTNVIKALLG